MPIDPAQAERMARLMAMAEEVWEDPEEARAFMNEPHALLGGKTPIEAAGTESGARQVERFLSKLEYGLPV